MKIYNTTTNEIDSLAYPGAETDCMADLTADDTEIAYNSDAERYEASGDSIQWWRDWAEADAKMTEMLGEVPESVANEARKEYDGVDMEDGPRNVMGWLTTWAGENGKEFREYGDGSIGLVDA